jgi:bisphosphoglycerate-dependent phosphoglycerate mutase
LQFTKLNPQSHLYTSALAREFPGKRFKVTRLVQPNSKNLKPYRKQAWEVVCRNYPDTVESLRKKHQLIPGGKTQYLLFTRDVENKPILIEAELETV